MRFCRQTLQVVLSLSFALAFSGCNNHQNLNMFDAELSDESTFQSHVAQFMIEQQFGHTVHMIKGKKENAQTAFDAGQVDFMFGEVEVPANHTPPIDPKNAVETIGSGDKISVRNDLHHKAPEVIAFLKNMKVDQDTLSDVLGWKADVKADFDQSVIYFMSTNKHVWTKWFPDGDYRGANDEYVKRKKQYKEQGLDVDA